MQPRRPRCSTCAPCRPHRSPRSSCTRRCLPRSRRRAPPLRRSCLASAPQTLSPLRSVLGIPNTSGAQMEAGTVRPPTLPQEETMTELQRYLAEEIAEDHADGIVTRREAMRRLGLLGVSGTAASGLLGAAANGAAAKWPGGQN